MRTKKERLKFYARELRAAAKLIEDGKQRYSCIAAEFGTSRRKKPSVREFYQETMADPVFGLRLFSVMHFEKNTYPGDRLLKEARDLRVLCLCFAAAVADAGGIE